MNIESKQDIRITGLTVMKENTASIGNFIYDYDRIIADGIQLSNKNDHIIFDVEITNFENAEMGILKIDGLPDDLELVIDLENPKTRKYIENDEEFLNLIQKIFLINMKELLQWIEKYYQITISDYHKQYYIDYDNQMKEKVKKIFP